MFLLTQLIGYGPSYRASKCKDSFSKVWWTSSLSISPFCALKRCPLLIAQVVNALTLIHPHPSYLLTGSEFGQNGIPSRFYLAMDRLNYCSTAITHRYRKQTTVQLLLDKTWVGGKGFLDALRTGWETCTCTYDVNRLVARNNVQRFFLDLVSAEIF